MFVLGTEPGAQQEQHGFLTMSHLSSPMPLFFVLFMNVPLLYESTNMILHVIW